MTYQKSSFCYLFTHKFAIIIVKNSRSLQQDQRSNQGRTDKYLFFHLLLFSSKLYPKVQESAFTEIRRYKGIGEERKMFVEILFEYKLHVYNTSKKHKFFYQ